MRFHSTSIARMAQAIGVAGRSPRARVESQPLYDVVLVEDPLTMAMEAKARLDAVDPAMDRVNRQASAAVGLGFDLANRPTWYGRRCCFFVFEKLHEESRRRPVPFVGACPACQRKWEIRVRAGTYVEAATSG